MYNRRDNALMQYKTYDQALNGKTYKYIQFNRILIGYKIKNNKIFLAVTKMDKVKLFDKIVSVGLSKFPEIQIPLKNVIFKFNKK